MPNFGPFDFFKTAHNMAATPQQQQFSWQSTNLWTVVLSFLFGSLALSGLELSASPGQLATDIVYSVDTKGLIGSLGLILTNVINIGYHIFFKAKGSFWGFLSSRNFWVNLASALIGLLVVFVPGATIPAGTGETIVGLAYAQDFTGLAAVVFLNIITPIIRALRDKNAA